MLMCVYAGKELVKSMSVLTQLRKAANHPLLLRYHYSDDVIASMSTEIMKVSIILYSMPKLVVFFTCKIIPRLIYGRHSEFHSFFCSISYNYSGSIAL